MQWSKEEIEKIHALLFSEDINNQLIGLELLQQAKHLEIFAPLLFFLYHADYQRVELTPVIEQILDKLDSKKRIYWEKACKVLQKITKTNLKNFEKHLDLFDSYVKTAPRFSKTYYWLGINIRSRLDDDSKGLDYLRKAADFNPNDYDANYNYAYLLEDNLENSDLVIKHYLRCLKIDDSYYGVYHNLGKAYSAKGDFTNAIKIFREGLAKHPHHADGMIELSLAFSEKGNFNESRKLLESALKISPTNDLALNNLAFLLWDSFQEYDLALEHIQKALEVRPNYALYWHTLAEVEWYGFKNKEKALAALYKAKDCNENYTGGDAMIAELKLI